MTKLSPAARAVLNAAYEVRPWMVPADSGDIAAALYFYCLHDRRILMTIADVLS